MKKILLFFVALVATLSMNAQTTEIYKGNTLQKAYYGADVTVSFGENSITVKQGEVEDPYEGSDYKVVSKELPPSTGTAKRTGDIDVNWVQLWKDGPKFAECNIGATNATDYGHYLAWGGSQHKVDDHNTTNTGSGNLSGSDDSAYKVWGSNWRMPTKAELEALINSTNCTVEWIDGSDKKYNNTTVKGLLCTGKGDYASNSVFLPAAGYCSGVGVGGGVGGQGSNGIYWSSTPDGNKKAYSLDFNSSSQKAYNYGRDGGFSVRAVLYEEDN